MTSETDRFRKTAVLSAPLERVWRAFSDAGEFGRWFGAGFSGPFESGARLSGTIVPTQVDPEVAKLQEPHAGARFEVIVERVEPMRLLSFRWHPFAIDVSKDYSAEPMTLVEFELASVPDGTSLTVTESGFDRIPIERRAQAFEANEGGWTHQLVLVGKYLAQSAQEGRDFSPAPEEDFAAMFEASVKAAKPKRFERGQTIEGTIVAIGPEVAFVNVGGKGEALLEISELRDDDGRIEVAVGDRIQATVVSTDGGLALSRKLARGAATNRQLEDAFRAGLPVEGKVDKAVKGGYEVRIGGQRGFCPLSQIDTIRTADPAVHEGKVYTFRIIEFKDGGKDLVVSRRALLAEEQAAHAVEMRKSIAPGAVLTGRVASVRDFGAFIELGAGVQGLLHVSEMAWSRVSKPSELLSPGQDITVKVLRVDEDGQKISLGLKQLSGDPWSTVQDTFPAGQRCTGRVTRLASFGVFVELKPGVEGLMPLSETNLDRGADVAKAFPVGSEVEVIVLEADPSGRRIRLSKKAVQDAVEKAELRDYTARTEGEAASTFGSLADKLRGALKPRG